jgi:hypothetical protein
MRQAATDQTGSANEHLSTETQSEKPIQGRRTQESNKETDKKKE